MAEPDLIPLPPTMLPMATLAAFLLWPESRSSNVRKVCVVPLRPEVVPPFSVNQPLLQERLLEPELPPRGAAPGGFPLALAVDALWNVPEPGKPPTITSFIAQAIASEPL
jgi:hypothetical protein